MRQHRIRAKAEKEEDAKEQKRRAEGGQRERGGGHWKEEDSIQRGRTAVTNAGRRRNSQSRGERKNIEHPGARERIARAHRVVS